MTHELTVEDRPALLRGLRPSMDRREKEQSCTWGELGSAVNVDGVVSSPRDGVVTPRSSHSRARLAAAEEAGSALGPRRAWRWGLT